MHKYTGEVHLLFWGHVAYPRNLNRNELFVGIGHMVWAVAVGLVQRVVPARRRFTGYGSFQLRSFLRTGGL